MKDITTWIGLKIHKLTQNYIKLLNKISKKSIWFFAILLFSSSVIGIASIIYLLFLLVGEMYAAPITMIIAFTSYLFIPVKSEDNWRIALLEIDKLKKEYPEYKKGIELLSDRIKKQKDPKLLKQWKSKIRQKERREREIEELKEEMERNIYDEIQRAEQEKQRIEKDLISP